MSFDINTVNHADWTQAKDDGLAYAQTFRQQSNMVIMGAAVLFFQNSKNIAYLNGAVQYARAYKGLRNNAVIAFLATMTGAKFDKEQGEFVKTSKKVKALPEAFYELDNWVDWADREKPEPEYDAAKVEKSLYNTIKRKFDAACEEAAIVDPDDELAVMNAQAHVDRLGAMLDVANATIH